MKFLLIAAVVLPGIAQAADHRESPALANSYGTTENAPVDLFTWPTPSTTPARTDEGFLGFGTSPALPDGVPGQVQRDIGGPPPTTTKPPR